jgi:hypothetical protein
MVAPPEPAQYKQPRPLVNESSGCLPRAWVIGIEQSIQNLFKAPPEVVAKPKEVLTLWPFSKVGDGE